jgi:hypothetical protein
MHLIQGDMPLLRDLEFGPSNLPHGRATFTLFHGAPQLKNVILTRNFFKSVMTLPWAQLTHLEADCLYERECLEILRDAPLLVACTFRVCPPGPDMYLSVEVPAHVHLRDLVLHVDDEAAMSPRLWMVLDCLTLPVLCTLQVAGPCITFDSLAALISRSQCYLEDLRIAGPSLTESVYRTVLPPFGTFTLDL